MFFVLLFVQVMCVTQMETSVFTLGASRVDGRGQPQPTDISGQTCFDGSLDVDTRNSHMYTVTNNTEDTVLHGTWIIILHLSVPDFSISILYLLINHKKLRDYKKICE